jgi:acetyl esterase/lipase
MQDALALYDPDHQLPLPLPAAIDYARTVMSWAALPLALDVEGHLDRPYGTDRLQKYDVYAPPREARAQDAALPVLIFWHGGGWTNGYRQYVRFMAPCVVGLGMVLVAPSYRLAPTHPLPDLLDDAKQLLAHLATQLKQFGGCAHHVYLSGHSAGAHIAAMTALRHHDKAQGGPDLTIKACLPISGILDLHDPNVRPQSLEERVYSMALKGLNPALDAVYSPLSWCAGNRIPFAMSYGEYDSPRVMRSNLRMAALLQAQDFENPVPLLTQWPKLDHFQTHLQLNNPHAAWYRMLTQLVKMS